MRVLLLCIVAGLRLLWCYVDRVGAAQTVAVAGVAVAVRVAVRVAVTVSGALVFVAMSRHHLTV